jgi:hypothetical protein
LAAKNERLREENKRLKIERDAEEDELEPDPEAHTKVDAEVRAQRNQVTRKWTKFGSRAKFLEEQLRYTQEMLKLSLLNKSRSG